MADKKISALTAASTPLAGTEVLPIVQSGATVKVAVSDLTAGRAISATQITLTTGNVIVANGQGIDFSATPGTGTSELLNDYETGTWTPGQGSGLVVIGTFSSGGYYTKVGNQVSIQGYVAGSTSVSVPAAQQLCTGLPFATVDTMVGIAASLFTSSAGILVGSTNITANEAVSASSFIFFSATYFV